jgi:hypothetical protein
VSPPDTNIPPESIAPAATPATVAASLNTVPSKKQLLQTQTRTNWGKGENRDKLEKAINDWNNKEGDVYDDNNELINDSVVFVNKVGIPPQTFSKYILKNNPRNLGVGNQGKKRLMTNDDILFAGCVLARADRGNDGLSSKEGVDMIQELLPDVSRISAQRQIKSYVLPLNAAIGVLKKKRCKVQATTSDRTNINVAQQCRWHQAVDEVYKHLRRVLCQSTGKTFGEVMPDFLIGLDEMCLMSDAHGDLRVFASADKKKQEKLLQDSCCSITVVRMGTMSGTTGPTFFLMKGATRRKNFTNDYLIKYGMKPGSTIVMTKNAFMTDDAWLKVSKAIVKGYCLMPLIKENPNWHVAELLDGFRSHENVLEAYKL